MSSFHFYRWNQFKVIPWTAFSTHGTMSIDTIEEAGVVLT